jgi:hypothetical protein
MDFADINFTIPKANIFSGIEPCLAVVLASIPMMRALLGRSAPTPHKADQKVSDTEIEAAGLKRVSGRGFERLDDDSSNMWLTSMGLRHYAGISTLRETIAGTDTIEDEESLDKDRITVDSTLKTLK